MIRKIIYACQFCGATYGASTQAAIHERLCAFDYNPVDGDISDPAFLPARGIWEIKDVDGFQAIAPSWWPVGVGDSGGAGCIFLAGAWHAIPNFRLIIARVGKCSLLHVTWPTFDGVPLTALDKGERITRLYQGEKQHARFVR